MSGFCRLGGCKGLCWSMTDCQNHLVFFKAPEKMLTVPFTCQCLKLAFYSLSLVDFFSQSFHFPSRVSIHLATPTAAHFYKSRMNLIALAILSFPFFFHKLSLSCGPLKHGHCPVTRPIFPPGGLGFIAYSIYEEVPVGDESTCTQKHTYTHTEERGLEMLIQTHRWGV